MRALHDLDAKQSITAMLQCNILLVTDS